MKMAAVIGLAGEKRLPHITAATYVVAGGFGVAGSNLAEVIDFAIKKVGAGGVNGPLPFATTGDETGAATAT
ncbi:MAG: hypothetical protein JOZ22_18865 [Acidobacteriia bacterium]|nr:hypothetical protein [Terriglobia bacterium]